MKKLPFNNVDSCHLAVCCCCSTDAPVIGGLGYSPAEAARMVDDGIPVTANNTSLMDSQGVPNPSWDVPLERKRGVDLVSLWDTSRCAKQRILDDYNKPQVVDKVE